MNKKLLTFLLALTFIGATAADAAPRHDKHGHHDRHRSHHGHHYKPKKHHSKKHHYSKKHHGHSYNHHGKHKRHHRHEAGYFLGGLFIGSMLANNQHHDTYYIRRQHRYSGPVYYRNEYGSCFRVEQRPHRDLLIEVPRDKCAVRRDYW